ncbi:hypothetical protein OBBRIDRAFT_794679 [Obba rivulosa]|uniref:Uncharacterized protein n=1 Tax=Obba rivulosa TaxID=1052685 RepID=A0A8E2AQD7_9APHY|nr:hypothetical protein OBBRIDRAFT_794679 [Obba rivulosa]
MTEEPSEQEYPLRGPVRIPANAVLVSDADEEIFLLYTDLSRKSSADGDTAFRGLGHLDSHRDTLTLKFRLNDPSEETAANTPLRRDKSTRRTRHPQRKRSSQEEKILEIELAQDKTSLRSRKGDTGSVVWRASVDLAQLILLQHHSRNPRALFNTDALRDAHIVELGAGTGLLSIVMAPLVRRYTATDIDALVPLIRKNVSLNVPGVLQSPPSSPSPGPQARPRRVTSPPQSSADIVVEALDWITLHNASRHSRQAHFAYPAIDLLLVVDCIYHPSLLPALVSTIDHLTTPGRTAVLVIVELRAEDVVREFLERWLALSSDGGWEIWSIPGLMEGPYSMWVGWKRGVASD